MPATSSCAIRDVTLPELNAVLELNEASVPHVNSLDMFSIRDLLEQSAYFRIATLDDPGVVSAFLIGLTPEALYASPNFLWFRRHYPGFAYIDRIAVADSARRRGLASALYDDFESRFSGLFPVLACEVNLRPENPGSMKFHLRRGFSQAGVQVLDEGNKEVAMLVKPLS